jgi:hypothetical protein
MTPKHVEQFLGENSLCRTFREIDLGAGKIHRLHYYPDLGVWVSTVEQAGVLQVDKKRVTFVPPLD